MRNVEPILHERVIHVTCYKGNIKNHKDFGITAPAPIPFGSSSKSF